MKKLLPYLLLFLLILVAGFWMGPRPPKPILNDELPVLTTDLSLLENYVAQKESVHHLKPDNQARFLWANDSLKEQSEYVLLYLHGFSASWYEGYPVNVDFVRHFGCNAYFARLASHGIDTTEALIDMTPERLWDSAKEAFVIAGTLGKKVIIMATSTGANLALKLTAEFPGKIHGLILYSPNMQINNPAIFLMSKPWGLQIGRMVTKGNYRIWDPGTNSQACSYWICKQRVESIVYLQQLVEATATREIFRKVSVPVFMGYYYKNDTLQDQTVRVDAALKMFDQLGTPPALKRKQSFPEAGDHVICNEIFSKSLDEVRQATFSFAEEVLGMK